MLGFLLNYFPFNDKGTCAELVERITLLITNTIQTKILTVNNSYVTKYSGLMCVEHNVSGSMCKRFNAPEQTRHYVGFNNY